LSPFKQAARLAPAPKTTTWGLLTITALISSGEGLEFSIANHVFPKNIIVKKLMQKIRV